MAKVRIVKIVFPPSVAADVVNYRMYYVDTGGTLDYSSLFVDLPNQTPDPDGDMRFDASALVDTNDNPVFTDGRYDIGVVAIDDAGNESPMSKMMDVPFDFVAPDAPGPIRIEVV
jgi:hypothetical protein